MAVSIPKVCELLICILIIDNVIKREKCARFTRSADKSRRAADVEYPLDNLDCQQCRQNERSGKYDNGEYSRADRRRLKEYERRGERAVHQVDKRPRGVFALVDVDKQARHYASAEIERNIQERDDKQRDKKRPRYAHFRAAQRAKNDHARCDEQYAVHQYLQ